MIQFNPLTLLGVTTPAQTPLRSLELIAGTPDTFTALGNPTELLNGTLSGLTVAAAIAGPLGSPTLARICSHPLFAGAALMAGASNQAHAWGQVGGFISGALLLLSTVATVVSGYSFVRGFKAGWQALKASSRLAVFDRVRTLQKEVETKLERAARRTKNPILADAQALSLETHANVKAAEEHFKDLRDEKPERIAAARLSGMASNPSLSVALQIAHDSPLSRRAASACASVLKLDVRDFAHHSEEAREALRQKAFQAMGPVFLQAIRDGMPEQEAKSLFRDMGERLREALKQVYSDVETLERGETYLVVRRAMDDARQAAESAAEKAALGARLIPATLSRMTGRLDPESAEDVSSAMAAAKEIERLLATATHDAGVRTRWQALPRRQRGVVQKTALHAMEAQRVASASPRNWVSEAIGDPTYSPLQKQVGRWLGENLNPGLMYALPALATASLLTGGADALGWLLSLAPAAATYLYNARQARRRFHVSPAPNQDLPLERYADEILQKRTVERLERAIPPMHEGERERFVQETRESLDQVEADLAALEGLQIPSSRSGVPDPSAKVTVPPEAIKVESVRRFPPILKPDPDRRYAYRRGGPETEEKRRLRSEIKAMSLDQIEDAIRSGAVTHVDILNMISDHPEASNGAVFPRPLTGKLRRELMKLAREADRTGVIRHFVAVKDLFPGVDGVVTAGSKTMYLTDLPPSPLVQRLIAQGFIPIPCGLTAGANGGSGLYNGHGAVGNGNVPGHDTGGSSSASAYVLTLKDMPIRITVGSDTGGSITAPCGAANLYGWVPEKGMLSRINMIPFATHLDTPGVMGVAQEEVLRLVKALTVAPYQSQYRAPKAAPEVYYFEGDTALVSKESRENFERQAEDIRARGFSVTSLDARFQDIRKIPLALYPDSYVAAAFTLMNPLQVNFMEPQRYILDRNLQNRLAKAHALLTAEDATHGNLFNRFLDIHVRFRNLVQSLFPEGSVLITPAPEPVPLADFHPNGSAGGKLDSHDILGGMLKNRVDNAIFINPHKRLVVEGSTAGVLAVALGAVVSQPAAQAETAAPDAGATAPIENLAPLATVEAELYQRYPTLLEERADYGRLVTVLSKQILSLWMADEDSFRPGLRVPGVFVEPVIQKLFNTLEASGRTELLSRLRADDRNRAERPGHEHRHAVPEEPTFYSKAG